MTARFFYPVGILVLSLCVILARQVSNDDAFPGFLKLTPY